MTAQSGTTSPDASKGSKCFKVRQPCQLWNQHSDNPVPLIQQEDLAVWPFSETKIRSRCGLAALRGVLVLDHLQIRLRCTAIVEQDSPDGILTTFRKIVRVDVEDLAAGVVAKDQEIAQLGNSIAAIDQSTDRGRVVLQQRIQLTELDDRIRNLGVTSRSGRVYSCRSA